jgi:L-fuconolactonase
MSTDTTAAAPKPWHVPAPEEWLALHSEPVIEPELPIVDPHHHLWDRPQWRYLFDEIRADLGTGHNIRSTVFVQCRAMNRADGPADFAPLGETEFVNGISAMSASGDYGDTRVCAGIVGHANLLLGARAGAVLEAHVKAAGSRFKGIRHTTAWDADSSQMNPENQPPPNAMQRTDFREGFACLAPLGLSFDAWLYHPQLGDVTELARAFPQTSIILNHVGGPLLTGVYAGKTAEVFAQWKASMRTLATCPNVTVKLGGLGMRILGAAYRARPKPPSSEELARDWKPFIETCIELFGPDRCMFESNFPVDKTSYSYSVGWNAFKRLAAGFTPAEKASLFSGTATRVYHLAA